MSESLVPTDCHGGLWLIAAAWPGRTAAGSPHGVANVGQTRP